MTVESLVPMLRTWDLPASIAFYTQVLGFACDAGGADAGWASLRSGDVALMLSGPNEHVCDTAPAFTGSLYFRVREVERLWAELKDKVRVSYPLEDFPYGMSEFAVYDNNGYLLQFGQEIGGP
jgi:uncharacterized glyoxalase superfamily protein PhnB